MDALKLKNFIKTNINQKNVTFITRDAHGIREYDPAIDEIDILDDIADREVLSWYVCPDGQDYDVIQIWVGI